MRVLKRIVTIVLSLAFVAFLVLSASSFFTGLRGRQPLSGAPSGPLTPAAAGVDMVEFSAGSFPADATELTVVLQPGETDGAQWATFAQVHEMIRNRQICKVIGKQFLRHAPMLLERQTEK